MISAGWGAVAADDSVGEATLIRSKEGTFHAILRDIAERVSQWDFYEFGGLETSWRVFHGLGQVPKTPAYCPG